LPLGWIGHDSWQKLNAGTNEKKILSQQAPKALGDENTSATQANKPLSQVDPHKTNEALILDKKTQKSLSTENVFNVHDKVNLKSRKLSSKEINPTNKKERGMAFSLQPKKNHTESNKIISNENTIYNNKNENIKSIPDNDKTKTPAITNDVSKNSDVVLITQADNAPVVSNKKKEDEIKSKTDNIQKNSVNKDGKPLQPTNETNNKQAKSPVALKKDFHFYAGIMAGADISTIKFQSVKGMGYSAGLLLGYHFSHSKFNIETGFYWNTKKYYTSGEYFNKKNVPYLMNEDLRDVNGKCNMFEIPVNVRYNMKQTKSSSFFAVLGLSSYLMSKEAYSYGIRYSNGLIYYHNYSYYHSTQNWFSVMNLSIGYEHRLGRIGDIRIEPYAKLPISGIGKGSLAIMSAGLNVGISKRF
jgi:hypothetical protein